MAFDPSVVSNPFAALSFIAAPAVLTNAASVLAMSTSNRFLRASDRMRALGDRLDRGVDSPATRSMFRVQVQRVGKQSALLLHGLFGAVLAVATDNGAHIAVVMALVAGCVGVCGLVFSTFNLFRATRLSMLNIVEEAALIRQRHDGRDQAGPL
jgi:hypothetical protein